MIIGLLTIWESHLRDDEARFEGHAVDAIAHEFVSKSEGEACDVGLGRRICSQPGHAVSGYAARENDTAPMALAHLLAEDMGHLRDGSDV